MNKEQGNKYRAQSWLGFGGSSSSMLGLNIYLNTVYRVNGVYMNLYPYNPHVHSLF